MKLWRAIRASLLSLGLAALLGFCAVLWWPIRGDIKQVSQFDVSQVSPYLREAVDSNRGAAINQATRILVRDWQPESRINWHIKQAVLAIRLRVFATDDHIAAYVAANRFYLSKARSMSEAAQLCFGKPALDISPIEAATLDAMAFSPGDFAPGVPEQRPLKRRNLILQAMASNGVDFDLTSAVLQPFDGCWD